MQGLTEAIQTVTSQRSNHAAPLLVVRDLTIPPPLPLSHAQTLMDKRVEIHGTSRADMNGKRGVAIDFHMMGGHYGDPTTWRYTVKLDGGEAFKVKGPNVRAEGTGGGGGGGGVGTGKAKGKGFPKKGRGGRK